MEMMMIMMMMMMMIITNTPELLFSKPVQEIHITFKQDIAGC
jgi:hypothetical protein